MKALVCASLIVIAFAARAADLRVAELTERAKTSIAAGNFEEATAALASALEIAVTLPDPNERIQTAFALARAHERWAAADPERKQAHYKNALEMYEKVWRDREWRRGAHAAAWNNCAQIYAALGDDERAADFFERAVAAENDMASFYRANFGTFLASRGNTSAAIQMYRSALERTPDDTVTEAKLLALYRDKRVAEYLWNLVGRNELDRARNLAVANLERDLEEGVQRDLLAILAVALARQHVSPDEFAPVIARLRPLVERAAIAKGVRELRQLYGGAAFDAASYSWWRSAGPERSLPAVDSPLAFSTLACELGQQARKTSPEKAERYFRLALDVSGGLDPEPFILLPELLYSSGRKEDLKVFSDAYREQMMAMKGAAYRRGDWRSVYRYHVALGTIYARLGWDGDVNDPRSAIYHLERARTVLPSIVIDPRSVDLLAKSYARADPESGKDLQVRIEVAEEYARAGRTASAKRVLEPAVNDPRAAQDVNKVRIDKLRAVDVAPERVRPRRATVRLLTDLRDTDINARGLEMVLSDYYSAPENMRSDVASKLEGFGIVERVDPVEGKGSVVVRQGGKTVTIAFELKREN